MADPHPADAFRELAARGLLATTPAPQPLARGNLDRQPAARREAWRVHLPGGGDAKLTLGPALGPLAARHTAFAQACPGIVPAPLFHARLTDGEAFAESFFAGTPLDAGTGPTQAAEALTAVCRVLAATEQSSTESARLAEWQAWCTRLQQAPVFTAAKQRLLGGALLPALYARLAAGVPRTRWSNGDLVASNILAGPGGPRLIDAEFAHRTHFFAEDAVRFHTFSPLARAHPELFIASLPDPGPAWHLYFWLRQFLLEAENNTTDYCRRVRDRRLAVIRRLAEQVLGCALPAWPVESVEVHAVIEQARWTQAGGTDLLIQGWCHVPSADALRAIVVTSGDRRLAAAPLVPRPDVQQHFAGEPRALPTGFTLEVPLSDPDAPLLLSALTDDGTLLPFHALRAGDLPGRGPALGDYAAWAAQHDPDPPPVPPPAGPLFSILLPVYRTPPAFLRECLDSVIAQHYSHWELLIVDDGSNDADLTTTLQQAAARDSRIRLLPRAANGGIARATNDALAAAAGGFIVLLDHDDRLRPHALAELAAALRREPALDALYSDEDKISAAGQRVLSMFKPDFSPEFLLGVMYVGHVLCIRTAVARAAGGFDPAFDGIQDYEFFLRVTEQTRRIGHVAKILYHWRQSPGSSALHGNVKGDMNPKQVTAVRAHLLRRGDPRTVTALGEHRMRVGAAASSPSHELVRCPAGTGPLAVLQAAAMRSTAAVLVLLDETAPASGDWLAPLIALAAQSDSGFVAPLLLAREGRILEAGWTTGPAGRQPLMRGFDPAGDGYHGSLVCNREVAAVSPLCVAVRRELLSLVTDSDWWEGGEQLRARGLFQRVCAGARVSLDRSWRTPTALPGPAAPDPFFNCHFNRRRADYSLAPSRRLAFRWHLDTPLPATLEDGCLTLQGWCFREDGQPCTLQVTVGELSWSVLAHQPRPDVAAAHPDLTDGACGFSLRLRVPAGRPMLTLEAIGPGESLILMQSPVSVPLLAPVLRWLVPQPANLLAFQMLAGPSRVPIPLRPEKFPATSGAARPKLSIVTPSFNHARFLGETMRSVLAQPAGCEYVVQDGGSTDGSVALIQAHAPQLKSWASAPDDGQADAIARGFARTSGGPDDVMAWINSDDFYLPGALAFVADYFASHPEVDVVYGHRIVVDENSQEIGRWFLPPHDLEVLRLNDFVPQETLFWRRRIWDRAGGIDPSFRFALDWDLLLRFQQAGAHIVRVPYFLACFRVHAAQKTTAAMHSTGQAEITRLRERTFGRALSPQELEQDPRLFDYLRQSAFAESLWELGIRVR
jgi:glycosyltransferase involved in cell wall biosynthesis